MKKIYYYAIFKRTGLISTSYNTFQLQSIFDFAELAEKERKEYNKTSDNVTYFVNLTFEEIEKDFEYKGYYITKVKKEMPYSYYNIYKKEDGKRTFKFRASSVKRSKELINIDILSDCLFDFQKGIKQYRPYSVRQLIIEKSFNHGNGSLALFKIMPKEKKIKVNSSLATKRDMEYIKSLQKSLRLEKYELTYKSYYYPEYYRHNF